MRILRAAALAALLSVTAAADDLMPLSTGWEWTYDRVEGQGQQIAEIRAVEQAGIDGPFEVATVAVIVGGMDSPVAQRVRYGRMGGATYRFAEQTDRTIHSYDPPLNVLEPRIEAGVSWTWRGTERWEEKGKEPKAVPAAIRFEVEALEEVRTGAGSMKAYRIRETHESSGVSVVRWYAPGTGVVQEREEDANGAIYSMSLESFRKGR